MQRKSALCRQYGLDLHPVAAMGDLKCGLCLTILHGAFFGSSVEAGKADSVEPGQTAA